MPRLGRTFSKNEQKNLQKYLDVGRIYMAEVMDTRNLLRAGEIKVWVIGSQIPRDDASRWITANYASSFYGTTPYEANDTKDFDYSPTSFGAWFPMPFIGNRVFIFYPAITGENINAYWFACPVNPIMNSMVPGIPAQYFGTDKEPLTEMNDKMPDNLSSVRGATLAQRENGRSVYKPLKEALKSQGLTNDNIRGYSTAGSKREAPSMCYGFLTPFGNSFTMDDGWTETDCRQTWDMGIDNRDLRDIDGYLPTKNLDEKRNNAGFRLRTRNGTQVWIGDEGNIYMINRDGTAWCEISEDGKLHGYAKNSVDIASDGDINLKSKKKIRMEADEGFVFKTSGDVSFESAGNINVSAPHIKAKTELSVPELKVTNGTIDNLISSSAAINGIFSGSLDGTAYYATTAGTIPAQQPIPYTPEANVQEPVLEPLSSVETTKGVTVQTVNTEIPAHEPYSGHTNNSSEYIQPILNTNVEPYSNERVSYNSPIVSNQVAPICPVPPEYDSDETIPQEQLTEHFTLSMLCYSDTAKRRKISNVPNDDEKRKLKALAENVLEPIWQHYNQRVIVNSGYRGKALNAAVGGALSSQHCKGEAADIEIQGISNYELACWIKDNLPFDQLILEFANNLSVDPNSGWVHVSYKNGALRRQCLTINKYGTRQGLRQ